MYELDTTLTRAINDPGGSSSVFDFLTIWISSIGVLLLVLAVVGDGSGAATVRASGMGWSQRA